MFIEDISSESIYREDHRAAANTSEFYIECGVRRTLNTCTDGMGTMNECFVSVKGVEGDNERYGEWMDIKRLGVVVAVVVVVRSSSGVKG